MKKFLFAGLILTLTACGEKDQEYFLKNPEKAEAKYQQCQKEMKEAFAKLDEKAYKKAQKDPECVAAHAARQELRRQQAEKERLEREAKEKALLEENKQKLNQEFGQLAWQDFATQFVNTQCATAYISNRDYHCRALKSLYEDKVAEAMTQLGKLSFEELKGQEKQYCSRDKRRFSVCDIWKGALATSADKHFDQLDIAQLSPLKNQMCSYDNNHNATICNSWQQVYNQKNKEVVDAYIKNYDALKQDYNQCIQRLAEIGNHWKDREKREAVSDYYPCAQAREARSTLGLSYDNFKTLME